MYVCTLRLLHMYNCFQPPFGISIDNDIFITCCKLVCIQKLWEVKTKAIELFVRQTLVHFHEISLPKFQCLYCRAVLTLNVFHNSDYFCRFSSLPNPPSHLIAACLECIAVMAANATTTNVLRHKKGLQLVPCSQWCVMFFSRYGDSWVRPGFFLSWGHLQHK